jgi:hypothetical protein
MKTKHIVATFPSTVRVYIEASEYRGAVSLATDPGVWCLVFFSPFSIERPAALLDEPDPNVFVKPHTMFTRTVINTNEHKRAMSTNVVFQ